MPNQWEKLKEAFGDATNKKEANEIRKAFFGCVIFAQKAIVKDEATIANYNNPQIFTQASFYKAFYSKKNFNSKKQKNISSASQNSLFLSKELKIIYDKLPPEVWNNQKFVADLTKIVEEFAPKKLEQIKGSLADNDKKIFVANLTVLSKMHEKPKEAPKDNPKKLEKQGLLFTNKNEEKKNDITVKVVKNGKGEGEKIEKEKIEREMMEGKRIEEEKKRLREKEIEQARAIREEIKEKIMKKRKKQQEIRQIFGEEYDSWSKKENKKTPVYYALNEVKKIIENRIKKHKVEKIESDLTTFIDWGSEKFTQNKKASIYDLFKEYAQEFPQQATIPLLKVVGIGIKSIGAVDQGKFINDVLLYLVQLPKLLFGYKPEGAAAEFLSDVDSIPDDVNFLTQGTSHFPAKDKVLKSSEIDFGKFMFLNPQLMEEVIEPCYQIFSLFVTKGNEFQARLNELIREITSKKAEPFLTTLINRFCVKVQEQYSVFIPELIVKFIKSFKDSITDYDKYLMNLKRCGGHKEMIGLIEKMHIFSDTLFLFQNYLVGTEEVAKLRDLTPEDVYLLHEACLRWGEALQNESKKLAQEVASVISKNDAIEDSEALKSFHKYCQEFCGETDEAIKKLNSVALLTAVCGSVKNQLSMTQSRQKAASDFAIVTNVELTREILIEAEKKKSCVLYVRGDEFYFIDPEMKRITSYNDELPKGLKLPQGWELYKPINNQIENEKLKQIKDLIANNIDRKAEYYWFLKKYYDEAILALKKDDNLIKKITSHIAFFYEFIEFDFAKNSKDLTVLVKDLTDASNTIKNAIEQKRVPELKKEPDQSKEKTEVKQPSSKKETTKNILQELNHKNPDPKSNNKSTANNDVSDAKLQPKSSTETPKINPPKKSKFWLWFFISMGLIALGMGAIVGAVIGVVLCILVWHEVTAALIVAAIFVSIAILSFALDIALTECNFIRNAISGTIKGADRVLSNISIYERYCSPLVSSAADSIRPKGETEVDKEENLKIEFNLDDDPGKTL